MQRTRAPFRADEVGSLLRPPRKCSTAGDGIVIFAVTWAVSHCFFRKRK